jgi:hypothetical protein
MPILTAINGQFNNKNNAALAQDEHPLLTNSGDLHVVGNAVLESLSMPKLAEASCELEIGNNPCLPATQANALVTQGCFDCFSYCAGWTYSNGTMTCP